MKDDIEASAKIVAAFVCNNAVPASELANLLGAVHAAVAKLRSGPTVLEELPEPAVPIKKSVTPNFLVCLEDGKEFRSLKRHLKHHHDLSPEAYRAKWGLAYDYPMVAPVYSAERSKLAKTIGLGVQPRSKSVAPRRKKAA